MLSWFYGQWKNTEFVSRVYTDKRCSGFHDHTSIKYIKKIWIKGCQQKLLLINMRKFWKVDFYIVNDLYLMSWLFLSHLFLNEVALWSLVRYIGIISYMKKHRVKTYRIVSYILQKKNCIRFKYPFIYWRNLGNSGLVFRNKCLKMSFTIKSP